MNLERTLDCTGRILGSTHSVFGLQLTSSYMPLRIRGFVSIYACVSDFRLLYEVDPREQKLEEMLGDTMDQMGKLSLEDEEELSDYIKLLQAMSELAERWPQLFFPRCELYLWKYGAVRTRKLSMRLYMHAILLNMFEPLSCTQTGLRRRPRSPRLQLLNAPSSILRRRWQFRVAWQTYI